MFKVGGNAAATQYFISNGARSVLNSNNAQVKYTSRAALSYRDELKRRADADAKQFPEFTLTEVDTPVEVEEQPVDDDFFSSWSKPMIQKPTPPPSRTATPPVIGVVKKAEPRVVTSSAVRRSTDVKAPRKKTAKVAVAKAAQVDFDELERIAREEEAAKTTEAKPEPVSEPVPEPDTSKPTSPAPTPPPKPAAAPAAPGMERLGMGMQRLALKQQQQNKKPARISTPVEDDSDFARKNFASSKSISSDQYFGRGDFDPDALSESRSRLTEFQGAQSISSNQYFGREEDEPVASNDLEMNARDFARRFMNTSGEDIQNMKEAMSMGAEKLSTYLQDFSQV